MVNLDIDTHEQAKKSFINISDVCDKALKMRINPTKKDVDDKILFMKCGGCGAMVEMGYYCQFTKQFLCYECERLEVSCNSGRTMKYPCKYRKNHEHIRIPGLDGQNHEIVVEVAEKALEEQNKA